MAQSSRSSAAASRRVLHFALHTLVAQLSMWGTSVRLLLAFCIQLLLVLVKLPLYDTAAERNQALPGDIASLIYLVVIFTVADAGYVMLRRRYPLSLGVDRFVLLLSEVVILGFVFVPQFADTQVDATTIAIWAPLGALFMLALRAVLGAIARDMPAEK